MISQVVDWNWQIHVALPELDDSVPSIVHFPLSLSSFSKKKKQKRNKNKNKKYLHGTVSKLYADLVFGLSALVVGFRLNKICENSLFEKNIDLFRELPPKLAILEETSLY